MIHKRYRIVRKESLHATVSRMVIYAPMIADKAQPGQFVIVRATENSERIPLTIADSSRTDGTFTLIYQIVGAGTMELDTLNAGDFLCDAVGPLGRPTELDGLKRVCVVGGGVGCAIAYPVAKKLREMGCFVCSIVGFRSKELVILEDEFQKISDAFHLMTDDGSYGEKGFVTAALSEMLQSGIDFDEVITIGPLPMMRAVCNTTRPYALKTLVSMNPIMVDGTGMCGGCRLTVGGETRFACVDGPDFDGHLVDFDEAIARSKQYAEQEKQHRERACRLLKEGPR